MADNQLLDMTRDGDDFRLESSMMLQLHERDMDKQIATAKKFPRRISAASSEIQAYATDSEDTAQECIYALPRDGKKIIGPTARFAEIVATSWGNARYAARIIDENDQFVVAQAVFHDLEKNTFISVEVPRRIVDRNGKRFGVDMIGVTSSAAMSIAMRNAILKGVPKAVWGPAYEKCLALIAGTFETIEARRTAALKAFSKQGVPEALVLQLIHKDHVRDIEPEDIVVLRGTLQAIKDGDTTLRAVFGDMEQVKRDNARADVSGHLEKGKARSNGKKAGQDAETGKQADTTPAKSGGKAAAGKGGSDSKPREDERDQSGGNDTPDGNGVSVDEGAGADDEATGGKLSASESNSADGDQGSDQQDFLIPEGMIPGPSDITVEWTDPEMVKLQNLANALLRASDTAAVGRVANDFMPIFEVGGAELEMAFSKMVADRRKAVRGSARDKL